MWKSQNNDGVMKKNEITINKKVIERSLRDMLGGIESSKVFSVISGSAQPRFSKCNCQLVFFLQYFQFHHITLMETLFET